MIVNVEIEMEVWRQQQLEELECMLSMFPTAEELEVPDAVRGEVGAQLPTRNLPVRYTLRIQVGTEGACSPLTFGSQQLALACRESPIARCRVWSSRIQPRTQLNHWISKCTARG